MSPLHIPGIGMPRQALRAPAGGTISVGISANTTDHHTQRPSAQRNGHRYSGLTPTADLDSDQRPWDGHLCRLPSAGYYRNLQPGRHLRFSSFRPTTPSIPDGRRFTVTVLAPSVASQAQGWIGSPAYGSTVSGVVPITLAPGLTLASGTLSFMPVNNPSNVTVLNANVTGSGQIGALDTTMLANGSYWIQIRPPTRRQSEYSLVLVTVTGNYKPGRVTTTVTDLVVPATGLAIQIQRTYDSLNAGTSGDFGYGWNLGINTNLAVDPSGNVTFTLGGQRKTFYLTPQMPPRRFVGCLFPYYFVAYTPEPGLRNAHRFCEGCPLDILVPDGSLWECYQGGGQYTPPGYIYTDPNGTAYNISAGGQLQSITDRSGNGLTITPNGITSTTGLNVPFVRDARTASRRSPTRRASLSVRL